MAERSGQATRILPALGNDYSSSQAAEQASRCFSCGCISHGTCKLEQYAIQYGADPTRFGSERKPVEVIERPGGIRFEPHKCIKCELCVQIAARAGERLGLTFVGRGFDIAVAVPFGHSIDEGIAKTARQCIDACPTGALAFSHKRHKVKSTVFDIKEARFLAPDVKLLRIDAPRIARKRRAGQFVIVRVHDHGERIPLTIADSNTGDDTITLIVQGVGKTSKLINTLEAGDALLDVVGPLGKPSEVERFGTVVIIGGGVGTAIAWPTAVAMKQAGNSLISIVGARSKAWVILEDEMRATSDELFVMTDDGSYGEPGLVTDKLNALIDARRHWIECWRLGLSR